LLELEAGVCTVTPILICNGENAKQQPVNICLDRAPVEMDVNQVDFML